MFSLALGVLDAAEMIIVPACQKCGSPNLRRKMSAGWETLLIIFTGTRRYCCFDCGWKFRAPDFRRTRDEEAPDIVVYPKFLDV